MWCLIADIPYNEDDEDYAIDINDDDDEHEGKINIFCIIILKEGWQSG